MKKLGGTDATFIYTETANTPQHVGSIIYLDVEGVDRARFAAKFRSLLLDRIHLLPYLTNRLHATPHDWDHPVWVRHTEFDVDEHLHIVTVDAPGTNDQVEQLAAKLYEPMLDRRKPLWKMWVVEGLENGQIAIVTKTHHACIDGMASVAVQEILGDDQPETCHVERAAPTFWRPDEASYATLMRESWFNLAKYAVEQWSNWPAQLSTATRFWQSQVRESAERPVVASKAPWNSAITSKRGLAGATFSLPTLKAVAKATRTKLNDVVLAITSEALNRYLHNNGIDFDGPMIAGCPVSLRRPGDQTMNNQVTMMVVSLENHVDDPLHRLVSIGQSALSAKRMLIEMGADIPTDFGAAFLPAQMQALTRVNAAGTFAEQVNQVPINLVVSNVPGLRKPVYWAGARILGSTPLSIVTHGGGLNVTVASYLDRLDLGLTAAANVVPDIDALRDEFVAAYESLVARALPQAVASDSDAATESARSTGDLSLPHHSEHGSIAEETPVAA